MQKDGNESDTFHAIAPRKALAIHTTPETEHSSWNEDEIEYLQLRVEHYKKSVKLLQEVQSSALNDLIKNPEVRGYIEQKTNLEEEIARLQEKLLFGESVSACDKEEIVKEEGLSAEVDEVDKEREEHNRSVDKQKAKKYFRKIAQKAHPDKVMDEYLNGIFHEAVKAYENDDVDTLEYLYYIVCGDVELKRKKIEAKLRMLRAELSRLEAECVTLSESALTHYAKIKAQFGIWAVWRSAGLDLKETIYSLNLVKLQLEDRLRERNINI